MSAYHFPRWTDSIRPVLGFAAILIPVYLVVLIAYAFSAENLNIGYAPEQPIPFSHALHAGELEMDCRYCHNTVEKGAMAAIPPTSTCMNCHQSIRTDSPLLKPLFESAKTGKPVEWVRVHDLPEFAYFNHSAHLSAGVSCVECHGRIDQMERVRQEKSLSMGWCLECHRAPQTHLRPREFVTDLGWETDEDRFELGQRLMEENNIHPREDCTTCHR
ncbi:MAG: cytochrome C [Planctomycetota bacterium]|nr:MAG: cytochrome C [Planctomycetota bacterium]